MFSDVPAVSLLLALALPAVAAGQGQDAGKEAAAHLRQAQQLLAQHHPEQAIPELQKAVALDPQNAEAQSNLGVLLYFSGQFAQAEPHLRTGLSLHPNEPKLQMLLGSCEHREGELPAASNDLNAAFAALTDPKLKKQAGLEAIEVDTAQQDLAAAATIANQLKTALPTDPEVLFAAYRTNTDLAGESLLQLSLAAPDSAQFHQAMAHEQLRNRDRAGAIANMRQALQADPNLPGGHFELGEMLRTSDQAAEKAAARQEYERAVAQQPNDPAALTRLGDTLGDAGDHPGAIAHYRQALAAEPDFVDAKIGLAYQLTESGQPEAALPLLQSALEADPTNVLAHYRLSAVYRRLHRPEDARREVAEYERLKKIKDKLRTVYEDARSDAPAASHVAP